MKRHNARWSSRAARALALGVSLTALAGLGAARAADTPKEPSPRSAVTQRQELLTSGQFRFNDRFGRWNPGGTPPVVPGLPGARFLGPGVQETYPFTPFQQPDILRNYLQMRGTSPRPNEFLGGQFNPQYRSTGFRDRYPYPYYGGYVDPYPYYGGYSYGGYLFSPVIGAPVYPTIYSTYGSWYPQYLPQERVILQREIYYVRPEAREEAPAARTEPRSRPGTEPSGSDYYLSRPRTESLEDAVKDIQRAWLNGDYGRFRARVREDGRVRIYLKGKYQYSVGSQDFGAMTRDAMARIDTTGFELNRVTNRGENRAFASGKHTYIDPEKNRREVFVSYGLAREDGRWVITEAGSSSTAITAHED